MKTFPVEPELLHADGHTDGHDETNNRWDLRSSGILRIVDRLFRNVST